MHCLALSLLRLITQSTQPQIMVNLPPPYTLFCSYLSTFQALGLMPQITFFYCESLIPRLVTSESHP